MRYLICLLFCAFYFQPANAELYKWVDDQGITYYSDKPSNQQKTTKVDASKFSVIPTKPETRAKRVVMYSVESCGYCTMASLWMAENKIAFIDYDIDKNMKAREEYRQLGKQVTPVIKLGDKVTTGFSETTKQAIKAYIATLD